MSPYTERDLAEHWEFKILRSATGAFRRPERLRDVLQEESKAGWMLVEKFDNGRIRLKRPAGARSGDSSLGLDPYRTNVGLSEHRLALMIASLALLLVASVVLIVKTLATR